MSAGLVSVADRRRSNRSWDVEDAYSIHFRTDSGVDGILQSSSASWGPMLIHTRIAGTGGTRRWWRHRPGGRLVGRADRGRPGDMMVEDPVPPPADLLVTAYDLLHATGIDRGPYRGPGPGLPVPDPRLPLAEEPPLPTFADGVAAMAVLDAARRSAAGWAGSRWSFPKWSVPAASAPGA